MPQLEAAGETIHYLRAGSGAKVIVLVHGFGSDARSWTMNQPALAAEATVYALDLPGHGASPAHDIGGLNRMAEVVAAAIALRTAELTPGLVRALTLIAPAGIGEGRNMAFIPGMLAMSDPASAEAVLRLLVTNPALINRQIVDGVLAARHRPHSYEAWQKMRLVAGEAWARRAEARAALGALPMPVQIIWGEQDAVLPPEGLEALPPNVRLHCLAGLGHAPHMEGMKAINRLILDFETDS
jgi:pyruvate dehydrogenase E2 component (dihydrolipoamide acetyltransferase)